MDLHKLIRESLAGEVPPIETEEPEPDVVEEPDAEEPQEAEPEIPQSEPEPESEPEIPESEPEPPFLVEIEPAVNEPQETPEIPTRVEEPPFEPEIPETPYMPESRDAKFPASPPAPPKVDMPVEREPEDVEPPFMPEFGTPAGEPPQRVDVDAVSSSQPSTETRSAGSFQAEVKHEIHVTHSMDSDTTQQIADQFGPRFEELKLTIEQQVRDYVDQQIVLLDRGRGGY